MAQLLWNQVTFWLVSSSTTSQQNSMACPQRTESSERGTLIHGTYNKHLIGYCITLKKLVRNMFWQIGVSKGCNFAK